MKGEKIYTLYFGDNWIIDGYKKEIINYLNINKNNFNTIVQNSKKEMKYKINSLRRIIIFIGYDYEFEEMKGYVKK